MYFGLHLPAAADAASPGLILRVAEEAERMGLASVWMSDGLLRPVQQPVDFGGGISIVMPPESASQCDAILTLAYVAARTSRIQLGTSVIGALFHNPVALARRLATLDLLSGGRLIAGLGQGWVPQAFAVAGVSPRRRGAGFEEQTQAMRAVWGPDPARPQHPQHPGRAAAADRARGGCGWSPGSRSASTRGPPAAVPPS